MQVPVEGRADEVALLRLYGVVDSSTASLLEEVLTPYLDATAHLVLDVSGLRLLAAAGVRALVDCGQQLAGHGRLLALVGAEPVVENGLRVTCATEEIALFPTLEAALASFPAPPRGRDGRWGTGDAEEMDELRRMRRDLRAQVRTRPLIGQAMGVVMERYRLPDGGAAFGLLRKCSQEHNLKLRAVAAAVIATPRPQSLDGPWFPGRDRKPMPVVRFLQYAGVEPANRSSVLDAVLTEALRGTGADRAHVQLVDPALDVLVLEKQKGFGQEFTDFFAHVEESGTACATARRCGERVTVLDVANDAIFAGRASRDVSLKAGSRAVQSTPVMNAVGYCVGMISTHAPRPGHRLTAREEAGVDALARETAAWLEWYQRTVVLEALEDLHGLAVAR